MKEFQQIPIQLLQEFEPQRSWLMHDSHLHGVDHMARVFILQELICQKLEAQGVTVNREAVRWAAMAHDVSRVDDGVDFDHGRRSAQWIKNNFSDKLSSEMLDIVTYIVHWHVPPDNEAPMMTTELQVLKDADALDRVRLGDLDPRYLRTDTASMLIGLAEELHSTYLNSHTDTTPFIAVVKAAQTIDIVDRGSV